MFAGRPERHTFVRPNKPEGRLALADEANLFEARHEVKQAGVG